MKLLITTFTYPPQENGVSHVVHQVAKEFARRGHNVTVATAQDPRRQHSSAREDITVAEFNVSGSANLRDYYVGELNRYVDFVGSYDCDFVMCHCWQTWSTDIAIRAFRNITAKKILVSHGVSTNSRWDWPRSIPVWLLWRPYVRQMPAMLKAFDHLVLLSGKIDSDRFYDHLLAKRIGYQNVSVIPNGVDLDRWSHCDGSFRSKYSIRTQHILLSVGAYSRLKNEEMTLESFIASRPEDTTLVFVGGRENRLSQRLTKRWKSVRTLLPSCDVKFLTGIEQADILSAYCSADLYVCSSKTECFPLTILDAMASGVPFISTNVGCVDELPGGITVSNIDDMTKQMNNLLANPTKRRQLGDEGRSACLSTFNLCNVIDQYEKLFNEIASR